MFKLNLLVSFLFFIIIAQTMARVVKWQPVSFNRGLPSWRTSQRSKQIQGYSPMSAFAESGSRPLFFGSWRKRFDEE